MPAFRRQPHQETAIVLSDRDATEQRIHVLYTEAVDQLGSGKVQVRFGGLHALERLAQDTPAQRQAVVNVICAYLRMPFSATTPDAAEGRNEPGADSEIETDGIDGTWQQERQVRLTAQRILSEHLRDDRTKDHQSAESPNSRFWNNIRLNLTGATLIDFNLVNGVIADANFHRAAFSGDAYFHRAAFAGDASFSGATFAGDASFSGAAFTGGARFGGAAFTGDALFGEATFGGDASFPEAAFVGDALFGGVTFSRSAGFRRAAFGGDAEFRTAAFTGDAWFDKATFTRGALFDETAFTGDAWFGEATFGRGASFDRATFASDAWFGEATFIGNAGFGEATFGGEAWFDKATFGRGASFGEAAFDGDAGFGQTALSGRAWFSEATVRGGADALHFEQARILSPGASHVWPTGWRLVDADGSGYTVVRANDDGGF